MSYLAHITDEKTGETRVKLFDSEWDSLCEFDWSENNNSCDCNRAIYFEGAGDELSDEDLPCGDWRFSVLITTPEGATLFEHKRKPLTH